MGPRLPRLFAFEIAWADAAYDAFFPAPPRGALVHGIGVMKPGEFYDQLLADISLEPSLGLRATLWMIALAPLFVLGRLTTIVSLGADDRHHLLERLLTSRIYVVRQLLLGFKAMGSLLYAKSPAIRRQMTTPAYEPLVSAGSLVRVKASCDRGAREHAAE
jgi:hypothetical protein